MNRRTDNQEALERGAIADRRFEHCAQADGWQVQAREHGLYTIRRPGIDGYSVDVLVKEKNKEHKYSIGHVWLEIRDVDGNPGWVYGDAEFIAFERDNGFLMVERKSLHEWVNENVERRYVTSKTQAKMCVYRKNGRKDMLTLVPDHILLALAQRTGGLLKDDR